MKKYILILTLSCFLMPLQAQNSRSMIPLDSPVYDLCKALYFEQGLGTPFPAFPWSEEELKFYLTQVDYGALSFPGQQAYNRIIESLKKEKIDYAEEELFYYRGEAEINLESYIHLPLETPPGAEPEDYVWAHGYKERLPLLSLPSELWFFQWLYFYTNFSIKEEHNSVNSPTTPATADNHWNMLDFSDPKIDLYFPFRGYISLGGEHWNMELGRDQLSWGNGLVSNMVLSDNPDYYDFLSFSTYWKKMKLSFFNMSLEPYLPRNMEDAYPDPDVLTFLGHRLDLKITPRVNFAVFEVILSTLTEQQLLKEFNHLLIYHNWLAGNTCYSIVALEGSINPWKGINFYAQGALDQFRTAYEAAGDGGGGIAKIGWLLGTEAMIPLGDNYLNLFFEWATTDPYLYHREGTPVYYNVRKYYSLVTQGNQYTTTPIGYKYGPDVMNFFLKAAYSWYPLFNAAVDIEFLLKGETDVRDAYNPEGNGMAPTGTALERFTLHLNGEYHPFSFLSTGTDLYFIHSHNLNNQEGIDESGFEWIWYVKYKY